MLGAGGQQRTHEKDLLLSHFKKERKKGKRLWLMSMSGYLTEILIFIQMALVSLLMAKS
jgi:hypothetical protein